MEACKLISSIPVWMGYAAKIKAKVISLQDMMREKFHGKIAVNVSGVKGRPKKTDIWIPPPMVRACLISVFLTSEIIISIST